MLILLLVHDEFVLQHLLCLLREVRWMILLLASAATTVDDNVAASEQMRSILLRLLHRLRLGIGCVIVVHLLLLQLQLLLSPNLLAVKVLLALWLVGLLGMG